MSTTIEWTQRPGTKGETWNPTTGCNKLSAGCKHCYAEVMHKRLQAMGQAKYQQDFSAGVVTHADTLSIPLKWKQPRTVFVNSMSDLFHADVPFAFIDQVFAVMALCPQHTFIILTKRPERMAEYMNTGNARYDQRHTVVQTAVDDSESWNNSPIPEDDHAPLIRDWPLPNVWLGTSVEDQATADARILHLLKCPAAVRFLSCEPLLGPVDLKVAPLHQWPNGEYWLPNKDEADDWKYHMHRMGGIHWVIAGGESGPKARPMHPDWARSLRDQCKVAGVPFFFKQWGEWVGGQFDRRKAKMICQEGTVLNQMNGGRIFWCNPGAPKMHLWDEADHYWTNASAKVGKARAGRLLDGVEHNEFPKR